jgi:hypothetical protein
MTSRALPLAPSARIEQAFEGRLRFFIAAVVFVGVTFALFAPLIGSLNSGVLAAEYTDARNAIRGVWLVQHLHSTPFTLDRDQFNGAPEGTPLVPAVSIASPFQPLFMWGLAPVVGLVASLNLFILIGFVATAFAAFALFDQLEFSFLPSMIGAFVVAFNPWEIERAVAGAPAFNHGWCLILLLWALIRLLRQPTLRSAAIAGAAYGSCFFVAAYFGFVGLALIAGYAVVAVTRGEGRSGLTGTVKRLAVMGSVTLLPLLPALLVFALNHKTSAQALNNPVTQLDQLGVSPISSYLVPSPRHPLLGHLAESLRPADPLREKIMFFGYVTLGLAIAGVVMLVRRVNFTPRQRSAMTLAVATAPIAFLLSLPRSLGLFGVTLYTPTYVFGLVTSYYRVYARVGYAAGIAMALLAVAALTQLARRRHGGLVVALLGALIVLEFLPGTFSVTASDQAPRYDTWLAKQPAGIVAHYPLPTDNELALILAGDEYYNQRFTALPNFALFGAGIGGTREDGIRLLARYVTDRLTPRILVAEGVRYVALHDDIYRKLHEDLPQLGSPFHYLTTVDHVRIYRVTPHPDSHYLDKLLLRYSATVAALQGMRFGTVVVGPDGFNGAERYHHVFGWRWMTENGTLQITNPYDHPMRFRLQGHVFSNTVPRTVRIQSATGEQVASFAVKPFERGLPVRPLLLAPGTTTFNLFADPGPQELGVGDPRQGSIFLSPIRAVPLTDVSLRAG